uniref:Uncharacterized protein n=1 Tax=Grammatophora oceanica TaxID=210454 RepID=A0A7S1Y751_9STRA|eukprot:CAMPEP_0194068292 /NCGR_PEP_ID=MMETSP0009_2-20130614/87016_1 /TAXON_ID=210454 /ORGANISM="Grammatophora oceanica, Strain CCMP 410" /LENGTH=113 /DNA_ID=CAMNT_0038721377 /DNA_START=990 /DNA_END=1331 /DNA_ORIENTATION=+
MDEKFAVCDGYVTFANKFKYFGLWAGPHRRLRSRRQDIGKAWWGQLKSMKPIFRWAALSMFAKYRIFSGIPLWRGPIRVGVMEYECPDQVPPLNNSLYPRNRQGPRPSLRNHH